MDYFAFNPTTETGIGLDQTPIIPGFFGTIAKDLIMISDMLKV